jgi:hypothetical protein
MRGHGTSFVRLAKIKGTHFDAVDAATVRTMIFKNFLWRLRKEGMMAASAHIFWDLGFYEAVNEKQATASAPPLAPLAAGTVIDNPK